MGNHILTWEQCIQIQSDLFGLSHVDDDDEEEEEKEKEHFLRKELNIIRFVWSFRFLLLSDDAVFEKNQTQISAKNHTIKCQNYPNPRLFVVQSLCPASLVWGTDFYRFPLRKEPRKKRMEIAFLLSG